MRPRKKKKMCECLPDKLEPVLTDDQFIWVFVSVCCNSVEVPAAVQRPDEQVCHRGVINIQAQLPAPR